MEDKFTLFLQDVPAEFQGYVMELDKDLCGKGCKREIKVAKSGFVTSYIRQDTKKSVLNYVFRKTGVKIRIYPSHIAEFDGILSDFPDNMKKVTLKTADCKKLIGEQCCPSCPAGFTFKMDGEELKKCRNMAFFYDLTKDTEAYIKKLVDAEMGA